MQWIWHTKWKYKTFFKTHDPADGQKFMSNRQNMLQQNALCARRLNALFSLDVSLNHLLNYNKILAQTLTFIARLRLPSVSASPHSNTLRIKLLKMFKRMDVWFGVQKC